ncbi:Uncharacterised protein [Mycobacteroides abscessus subsp. abscessus]|nr:Uncharacterised protein [Mycobacteroides abscessus subsp. abscessus]SII71341.1 Uncharacterised protein [Mycobacteroides abscessus subsp. abscessus]
MITSRAAASTFFSDAPGASAARPAACAVSTSSWISCCQGAAEPSTRVLVMSEWYPATSAPKSIFTKSPAASIAPVGR